MDSILHVSRWRYDGTITLFRKRSGGIGLSFKRFSHGYVSFDTVIPVANVFAHDSLPPTGAVNVFASDVYVDGSTVFSENEGIAGGE